MKVLFAMRNLLNKFYRFLFFLLGVWMICVFCVEEAQAKMNQGVIIEHLRISVPAQNREAWLEAEKGSWEPWLARKKGFIGRQLFWDDQNEQAVLMISWASREKWKAIPQSEIDQIQEAFEALARKGTGDLTGNPFPLQFEGQLFPQ